MGYLIRYDIRGFAKKKRRRDRVSRKKIAKFCFGAVLACVLVLGIISGKFKSVIYPGDTTVTKAAVNQMIEDIKEGESVAEALATFCKDVIGYEKS